MNGAAVQINRALAAVGVPIIRSATVADIDRLVAYAQIFWEQTDYAKIVEYDVDTMADTTADLIDNDVVLYAEDDGNVVGLLCVMISPFLMNRNYLSACEWGFYVDAEYRSSGLGIALIRRAEEILKEKKVTFFTLVSLANLRPAAVGRFYERLGFRHVESDYVKELSWEL